MQTYNSYQYDFCWKIIIHFFVCQNQSIKVKFGNQYLGRIQKTKQIVRSIHEVSILRISRT